MTDGCSASEQREVKVGWRKEYDGLGAGFKAGEQPGRITRGKAKVCKWTATMSGLFRWLVGSITTSPTTDPVEWMASRARSERRKPQLRKVESMSSSREASEESNAENTEGELLTSDASDEVVLPAVVHPGSSGGSEGILDSEALPGRVRAGVRAVGPTNTLLARGSFADPAAEDSSASTCTSSLVCCAGRSIEKVL